MGTGNDKTYIAELEADVKRLEGENALLWVALTHMTGLTHTKKEASEILDQLQRDINAINEVAE